MIDDQRLASALDCAIRDLSAACHRSPDGRPGHWIGELSTSALSTATAISAMAVVERRQPVAPDSSSPPASLLQSLILRGLQWLTEHQNEDGGWGDTDRSHSNIATTMLVQAAFHLTGVHANHFDLLDRAAAYVEVQGGTAGLRRRYGKDKTFAAPILTNAAIAGLVEWRAVPPLPFELACLPQWVYRFLRLPVVSYAIPALVAIGQARFHHEPPRNPLVRRLRRACVAKSLQVLEQMQPASGGFLEATPLTSFVVMSLASTGEADHPVVERGVKFLIDSVRPDGSWPIDTNLATWNTTLAMNALAAAGQKILEPARLEWLLSCQHRQRHRYTGAAAGGWAWTDLSGGVPDADDTSGALLALAACRAEADAWQRERIDAAALAGVRWLLDLQNRDGGWPTFCRGWGTLPFDRSGADLTAHALRALNAWRKLWEANPFADRILDSRRRDSPPTKLFARIDRAFKRGFDFLYRNQRDDGSWAPLWFGNQDHPAEENPIYGTARVLLAYRDAGALDSMAARRGVEYLSVVQNPDGGWGGTGLARRDARSAQSTVEETAVAVEALLAAQPANSAVQSKVSQGLKWLIEAVAENRHKEPAPIGFYFAKLWYYEELYPLTFAVSALGQAARRHCPRPEPTPSCAD
jgi:squalene-hopene/tetraprenyl-beta-curcumene cyclase